MVSPLGRHRSQLLPRNLSQIRRLRPQIYEAAGVAGLPQADRE